MKVNNNNPLDLFAQAGEVITIVIVEQNTVRQIQKVLNGVPLVPDSFTVPVAPDPTLLTVTCGFSGNAGTGRYTITLTGSSGGDTSLFFVHEPPGPKVSSVTYTIDVTN